MDEDRRAAALMRQRMAQTNGSIPMGAPPAQRNVRFNPQAQQTPHQSVSQLTPRRSPNPPVSKITGSGPLIPPKSDPLNTYGNIEKATGEPLLGEAMDSNSTALLFGKMVLASLLVSSIFVIPPYLKVFWITIISTIILVSIGFTLYYEWDAKGNAANATDDEKRKYNGWASTMLYVITMAYSAVAAAILLIMIWRIYSMVNKKSNLIAEPPSESETVIDDRAESYPVKMKKKKKNRMPFV